MIEYTNLSREDLIKQIETLQDQVDVLQDDFDDSEEECCEFQKEIDDLELIIKNNPMKRSLRDELKYEFLLENWDKIDLDDLEKIIKYKYSNRH